MSDSSPKQKLTSTQWLICFIASIGFAFDIYELLMLPLIARPALMELGGRRIIERVLGALTAAVDDVLLVTNTPELYAFLGVPMVAAIVSRRSQFSLGSESFNGGASGQQPALATEKASMSYQPIFENSFMAVLTCPPGALATSVARSLSAPCRGLSMLHTQPMSGTFSSEFLGR